MSELERMGRRLERERAARHEAEAIAERSTRALYDRQQELVLLEGVAAACNEAVDVADALRLTLERVCRHLDWPVGQAYLLDATGQRLVSARVGYCADEARFGAFARMSEQLTFAAGQGPPGRVLAAGAPVWIRTWSSSTASGGRRSRRRWDCTPPWRSPS